jgi:chemotaxis protein methyltransferase CheR
MTPDEYLFLAKFIQDNSGIEIGDGKQYLIESRLLPLAQKSGLGSITQLVGRLRGTVRDMTLERAVIDAMTTNESLFFRDTSPFECLRTQLLPALFKAKPAPAKIRIWSSASSTGQEPYSIAMLLAHHFPEAQSSRVEILATDVSETALKRAKEGLYNQFEIQRGIPPEYLNKFFLKTSQGWQINDRIKKFIEYRELNLIQPFAHLGPFDVIFCRNVLIYFNIETKQKVLAELAKVLTADGHLILGGAETATGFSQTFERASEFNAPVFRKKAATTARSA